MGDDPKKEAPVSAVQPVPRSSPPEPLEALFREHGAFVFRTAYRVTGRAADAEDVLQTVFLRLAGRRDAGSLGSEPRGYLHRAAVNGALDLVRSRLSAAGTVPLEERGGDVEARGGQPDAAAEARELRARLRTALAKLSPRVAEVFVLRSLEGIPNRQIALLLGSSPAVVAVQYFRARTQLRKELLTEGGGPS
ncbi:MAG: sigma-70 family RNA polymerase sigma factor [Holophagales bacterium]|jgi:RNA polymerase sigma-70 factor (ECF subfamily)|nr:sigma-70 family RNA polymerase sigma factor [Holophagales bacterium]